MPSRVYSESPAGSDTCSICVGGKFIDDPVADRTCKSCPKGKYKKELPMCKWDNRFQECKNSTYVQPIRGENDVKTQATSTCFQLNELVCSQTIDQNHTCKWNASSALCTTFDGNEPTDVSHSSCYQRDEQLCSKTLDFVVMWIAEHSIRTAKTSAKIVPKALSVTTREKNCQTALGANISRKVAKVCINCPGGKYSDNHDEALRRVPGPIQQRRGSTACTNCEPGKFASD